MLMSGFGSCYFVYCFCDLLAWLAGLPDWLEYFLALRMEPWIDVAVLIFIVGLFLTVAEWA